MPSLAECGTYASYVAGCRCERCRDALRVYMRVRRAQVLLPPGDSRHGTVNGYSYYGCPTEVVRQQLRDHFRPDDPHPYFGYRGCLICDRDRASHETVVA